MRKLAIGLVLVLLGVIGTIAYAHGPGWWGGGHMMGYGGGMMGWSDSGYYYDQKFLDETRELRKKLHDKRFEYFEALRDPETTPETLTKLEKEIHELQEKIYEKAPRPRYGGYMMGPGFGGHRHCW